MNKPIDELICVLEEIEIYKAQQLLGQPQTHSQSQPSQLTITTADINRIVNEKFKH